MNFKIAIYIHHHGLGHFMRTMTIVNALPDYDFILMGSKLPIQTPLPSHVRLVHLPSDLPDADDTHYKRGHMVESLHYSPLNVHGIRSRSAIITDVFKNEFPMILIVDVSVEVTLLARLCGIPTIVMRQHGKRTDLPHLLAYQSAELLIAPYPRSLYHGEEDEAYAKTVFTGGFSKFTTSLNPVEELTNHIAIIIGGGGSSLTSDFVISLASTFPDYFFHLLGNVSTEPDGPFNLKWHGHLENPQQVIEKCIIVIGNTGHNTVMEMANLNKRFIGIPEQRPFDEQLEKAEVIKNRQGIYILLPENLFKTDWNLVFQKLRSQAPDWEGVIAFDAIDILTTAIINTGNRLFNVNA
ncbi:glycosyltransferase [Pedobacter sp. AW31-3R]|uniref:glycosyltransferase n=1 Tax=Pedobacter sp. AW31-3R TaxID=3445781 RepID=UPI003F9F0A6E